MKVVKTDVLNLKSVIETPMRLSEFNTNERYEDIRSVVNFLINLILMVPGTIPEMPKMGYNLHSRRHFIMNSKELGITRTNIIILWLSSCVWCIFISNKWWDNWRPIYISYWDNSYNWRKGTVIWWWIWYTSQCKYSWW